MRLVSCKLYGGQPALIEGFLTRSLHKRLLSAHPLNLTIGYLGAYFLNLRRVSAYLKGLSHKGSSGPTIAKSDKRLAFTKTTLRRLVAPKAAIEGKMD